MPTLDNFSLSNYGLGGPAPLMKYATGVSTPGAATLNFVPATGGSINSYYILVTGLPFRPTRIIIRRRDPSSSIGMTMYNKDSVAMPADANGSYYNLGTTYFSGNGYLFRVYEITGASFNSAGQVTDNGFRLPAPVGGGVECTWEAWG